jgi:antitoxin ParD1/3/4
LGGWQTLASDIVTTMTTMNVSLPEELKAFVDQQVDTGRYGSTSEFVRDLIRREQDRQQLRLLLHAGAGSPPGPIADEVYFASLRQRLGPRH